MASLTTVIIFLCCCITSPQRYFSLLFLSRGNHTSLNSTFIIFSIDSPLSSHTHRDIMGIPLENSLENLSRLFPIKVLGSYFYNHITFALLSYHHYQLDNSWRNLVNLTCFSPLSDEKATPILETLFGYSHQGDHWIRNQTPFNQVDCFP